MPHRHMNDSTTFQQSQRKSIQCSKFFPRLRLASRGRTGRAMREMHRNAGFGIKISPLGLQTKCILGVNPPTTSEANKRTSGKAFSHPFLETQQIAIESALPQSGHYLWTPFLVALDALCHCSSHTDRHSKTKGNSKCLSALNG